MVFRALVNLQASSVYLHMMIFIFALTPTLVSATTLSKNFTIAKPNCVDRCGNISIPYPFGTTQECYKTHSFLVICNETFNPPKLFWQNSSFEIKDISLDGQFKLLHFVARDCYDRKGNKTISETTNLELVPYFTVNNTANKFFTVGCDTAGYFFGRHDRTTYTAGCTAVCDAKDDLKEGSCNGLGCCTVSVPENVSSVDFEFDSLWQYRNVSDFDDCGHAFVAEDKAFTFSPKNLTSLKNVDKLPMVVDWAIGNETCEDAKISSTTYACKSANSICYEPKNGYGYRCRCQVGYQGNPYLVDGCKDIDECRGTTQKNCNKKENCRNTVGNTCSCPKKYLGDGRGLDECDEDENIMKTLFVLTGIAFAITALPPAAMLLYIEVKRKSSRRMKQKFFVQNGGLLLQEKLSGRERSEDTVKVFSSSELEKATNNFHNDMIIGKGGFGIVYKGILLDKRIVAIKKSRRVNPCEIEQFINEVFVLSQVNHRNVVKLLGCCLETELPLLVYEFISNGTLSSHIHNQARARFLYWETRLKIAVETASVLSYLHSEASTPIIHRDVKSDNILLDCNFIAKVSDFGASKMVPLDLTYLSTMVRGTFGYLDPEYMLTNQLTEKSDVYSFGVVLLELLTGRKAISLDKPEGEKNLANYFLSILNQERLIEILDDNIVGDRNMKQILEVARLAKECLHVKGEDRPTMKEVAMELEGLMLGGKRSLAKSEDNANEIESSLVECVGVNNFAYGEGSSRSVGYDSLGYNSLISSGGR